MGDPFPPRGVENREHDLNGNRTRRVNWRAPGGKAGVSNAATLRQKRGRMALRTVGKGAEEKTSGCLAHSLSNY